jgi:hypothetical protein
MSEVSEEEWKRRFGMFAILRVTGLAMMLAGAFVGMTDLVRPGGVPVLGVVLGVAGAIDGILLPALLRRRWKGK